MTTQRSTPPDLALWLTGYVRAVAGAELSVDLDVDTTEPPSTDLASLVRPLIVIRDDSGPQLDLTTYNRSIGASLLHPLKLAPLAANDIARWLASVLFDPNIVLADPITVTTPDGARVVPNPIASVTDSGCNGPYAMTDELDVARRYLTAEYVVVGSW